MDVVAFPARDESLHIISVKPINEKRKETKLRCFIEPSILCSGVVVICVTIAIAIAIAGCLQYTQTGMRMRNANPANTLLNGFSLYWDSIYSSDAVVVVVVVVICIS